MFSYLGHATSKNPRRLKRFDHARCLISISRVILSQTSIKSATVQTFFFFYWKTIYRLHTTALGYCVCAGLCYNIIPLFLTAPQIPFFFFFNVSFIHLTLYYYLVHEETKAVEMPSSKTFISYSVFLYNILYCITHKNLGSVNIYPKRVLPLASYCSLYLCVCVYVTQRKERVYTRYIYIFMMLVIYYLSDIGEGGKKKKKKKKKHVHTYKTENERKTSRFSRSLFGSGIRYSAYMCILLYWIFALFGERERDLLDARCLLFASELLQQQQLSFHLSLPYFLSLSLSSRRGGRNKKLLVVFLLLKKTTIQNKNNGAERRVW